MKYVKIFGLLAVVAAALMAFAGSASATLTEAAGDPVDIGDTNHSIASGAISITGTITITCQKSTIGGTVTSNEAASSTGTVNSMTFEECGNQTVTVKSKGTLTINSKSQVSSTGVEITVLLHSFLLGTVHCIYTTNNTEMGVLTTGTPASLDIESVGIPRETTDGGCGEHSTLEGKYKVENPGTLLVD